MSATRPEVRPPSHRPALRGNPLAGALRDVVIGPVPVVIVGVMMWFVLHGPVPAFDFRFAYWSAGHRVLEGASPYVWTVAQFRAGHAFVYPALSAILFAPLALVERSLGSVLVLLVSAALTPLTLALLRVRDWRVYGITLIWLPVCAGWFTANESLFLMLGLACLWTWRDRPAVAGLLTAAMVSLKPMMWPLALWLLVTRRWRASAHGLVLGLLMNLAAWSIVGFHQIGAYLHATAVDTEMAWRTGFGVPALLAHLGGNRTEGIAAMVIVSAALVAGVIHSGLIVRDQVRALTLCVALAIVSSPLLWEHYLVLAVVPLCLLRPRLHWLWALPVLLWVAPPDARVHLWQALVFWCTLAVLFVMLGGRAARGGRPTDHPPARSLVPV